MQLNAFYAWKFHLWNRVRTSTKTMLLMRFMFYLFAAVLLQLPLKVFSQTITLSGNNVSLVKVFEAIKKQTGYVVMYKKDLLDMNRPVTLSANDMPLTQFLQAALRDQPVTFEIRQRTIFISRKSLPAVLPGNGDALVQTISGRVMDSSGSPLQGAIVSVKGEAGTAATDAGGRFFINAAAGSVLMIFYLGYEPVHYKVQEEMAKDLAFVLSPLRSSLNEIQVISTGYQKIEKYQLTGAVSSVNQKTYDQRVAVTGNFLESLEGKVPGLVYNSLTKELSIRGVSTFDAVKKPLIVVDGFPTEIDIRNINPVDVVSISVLRDAAAASIYGVRASNGVIVIETRRGKSGKAVFNLRGTTAFQAAPDFGYLKYAKANEFTQLQVDYFNASKPSESSYLQYDKAKDLVLEIMFDKAAGRITPEEATNRLTRLGSYDNLADYKRLFYRSRQVSNVNFDISGGNDRGTYLLGVNYIGEKPVEQQSKNKQLILNIANTYKLSDRFSLDFRGTYSNDEQQYGTTVPYKDFFPYEKLTDENGEALPVAMGPYRLGGMNKAANGRLVAAGLYDQYFYPYKELSANTSTIKSSAIRFQGRIVSRITDWATLEVGGAYESQQGVLDSLVTEGSHYLRRLLNSKAHKDPVTGAPLYIDVPRGNMLSKTHQKTTAYTLRAQFNFNKKLAQGKHDLSGIAGVEQRKTIFNAYKTTYFGFDGQSLISKPVNIQAISNYNPPAFRDAGRNGYYFKPADFYNEWNDDRRFVSFYAQGTYMFNQKYIATGSFRVDQSNLFGVAAEYKYKPLWSAGLSWLMNKEQFLQQATWLDELKLRVATGFNGNIPNSTSGPFLVLGTDLNASFAIPRSYNNVLSPENSSIRWETTRNFNVGIDYSFFHDRFSGSIDWYQKKSIDVFGQFDADPTTGFNEYNANTAAIRNNGLELLVNTLNMRSRKFEWCTQLTASFNKNKVLAVKATEYEHSGYIVSGGINRQGYPMDALFSYRYGGLNNIGAPMAMDRSGKPVILDFYGPVIDVAFEDLVYNGTTTPKYVLGLNNQFTIGSFDFSFLFMYYGGHVMRVQQPNPDDQGAYSDIALEGSGNHWRKPGDEAYTDVPGFVPGNGQDPLYWSLYARDAYEYASKFVRKADYIRLRDAVVTYNVKASFLKKMGFTQTQLRGQVQNAFRYTFSGNDIDPDAIDRMSGIRTLPQQPLYSFSLFTKF